MGRKPQRYFLEKYALLQNKHKNFAIVNFSYENNLTKIGICACICMCVYTNRCMYMHIYVT